MNQVTKPSFGRQKSEMEGMVANYTRDYEEQIQDSLKIIHADKEAYLNELVAYQL